MILTKREDDLLYLFLANMVIQYFHNTFIGPPHVGNFTGAFNSFFIRTKSKVGPVVSFVHLEFVLHEFSFVLHEFSLVKHECSFVLLEFVLHNAACLTWEIPAHRRKTYGGKDIVVIRGLNERAGAVPRDTQ